MDLPLVTMFGGFALTGLVTVLLGPALPGMSERWHIADSQAGLLFAAQFFGTTLTSIVTPWRVRLSLVAGYALVAAGMATLAFAGYAVAIAAFALLGMGLGLSLTATNLLVGSTDADRRGRLLTRANFFWAVGAVVCPPLIGLAERLQQMRPLLLFLAVMLAFVSVRLLPLLRMKEAEPNVSADAEQHQTGKQAEPPIYFFLIFAVILFLYVGTENSIGGWITEYSHRFLGIPAARASLAALTFWLMLVASRGIASELLRKVSEAAILLPATMLAAAGTLLLLLRHGTAVVFVAVAVAGLGCGPVFPLLTSRLFARSGSSRHVGWVFAACGCGGAILPWTMGLVSTGTGSLRTAFAVPLAALAMILLFILSGSRHGRAASET
ncbi:MFS transporter [Paracidobacterium acidisoli]|uniref:MFS transporter n=1 Tax=Paracidobacterium acidisoli TaxID=2303751 RepID=A0A372IUG1_9BACT|nr:MFS transporter [Paracidobacterium acidisoli]